MSAPAITSNGERALRIGVAGLGRAFSLMSATFRGDERVRLVAATDPRPEACARFTAEFGAPTYQSVEALCADPSVDVVYVATPHERHATHAITASRAGKHVLVEKPMAIDLAEAHAMIDAASAAHTQLIVGHSHSFDRPIARARELIASGAFGPLRMITALNFTDFMYRPRRPEELATAQGGGVLFSQAAHQIDIARLLAGGQARVVRAHAGIWDPRRPSEGAYGALLGFANGAWASLTYSGYAHFDSDELTKHIGELGFAKSRAHYGGARRALAQASDGAEEVALKYARNYGGSHEAGGASAARPIAHEHFGFVVASCDAADLRPLPDGISIYADDDVRFEALPAPAVPRREVIDELYDAVVLGRTPLHDGCWGRATLEVCLAMLASAREGREIALSHQVGTPS